MTTPIPSWDGTTEALVEFARQRLRLSPTDPDLPWLGMLGDAVSEIVRSFLDDPAQPAGGPWVAPIPQSVTVASVNALIEAYARKDAKFGVVGTWSADGVALRVSADWLDGVRSALVPFKVRFGVA